MCVCVRQVISLGDSRSYYLTIAKDSLGVVFGRCVDGHVLRPLSLSSMECPVTKTKVERKVAQLLNE